MKDISHINRLEDIYTQGQTEKTNFIQIVLNKNSELIFKNSIKPLNYSNKVIPIKYAISNIDDEKVFIDVQESLSSTAQVNIQGENENFIFTKTLDSLYKNENIDLIKMDIEGFEMNALQGAKEIIKNQTPTLILSAYHKNRDIYDFIDFVESLSTDYKLFCFHHPLTHHEIEYYFINKKLYKD